MDQLNSSTVLEKLNIPQQTPEGRLSELLLEHSSL